ncbi:hypothetical protein [Alteraurantiacibacter aquimixticola]|nr:hypothetical protein [Alteraurantiacibacter aquimixticola]
MSILLDLLRGLAALMVLVEDKSPQIRALLRQKFQLCEAVAMGEMR